MRTFRRPRFSRKLVNAVDARERTTSLAPSRRRATRRAAGSGHLHANTSTSVTSGHGEGASGRDCAPYEQPGSPGRAHSSSGHPCSAKNASGASVAHAHAWRASEPDERARRNAAPFTALAASVLPAPLCAAQPRSSAATASGCR